MVPAKKKQGAYGSDEDFENMLSCSAVVQRSSSVADGLAAAHAAEIVASKALFMLVR